MVHQKEDFSTASDKLYGAAKALKLSECLRKANIQKEKGVCVFSLLMFLIQLIFFNKNLFQYLHSEYAEELGFSKNTCYRFLCNESYNWKRLLLLVVTCFIAKITAIIHPDRPKTFILDDTPISKDRSKHCELKARCFNHVNGQFYTGFTNLTLGWSDGFSFIPVGFNLLSSSDPEKIKNPISLTIDKRTNAYKFRKEATMHKPDAAMKLIREAITNGIMADYVLMDSWFTTAPLINQITAEGLDVIGMVKNGNHTYLYQGKALKINQLRKLIHRQKRDDEIIGDIVVQVHNNDRLIPAKLVYVVNRKKTSEYLAILSTNINLTAEEIVQLYGRRWKIEEFFKTTKSLLKLGKECQSTNYGCLIAHTTIVYLRYVLIEFLRRNSKDKRTFGPLFRWLSDEMPDVSLKTALRLLMEIIIEIADAVRNNFDEFRIIFNEIACQVVETVAKFPRYIREELPKFTWES